jgi:hypothetical protein
MTTHVIKLAVGANDVADIERHQRVRSEARNEPAFRRVYTRHKPVRPDVLEGSLYWVVQGVIRCRQRLIGFDQEVDETGRKYCLFRVDPVLVPVVPTPRGPFQGWRYLSVDAAPADLETGEDGELPPDEMLKELRSLGLI